MARKVAPPPHHELIASAIEAGRSHLEEVGLTRFSLREVARRIDYAATTLIAWFGSAEDFVFRIGESALRRWLEQIEAAAGSDDTAKALVDAYFDFAQAEPETWRALYEHRASTGAPPQFYLEALSRVTTAVQGILESSLPKEARIPMRRRIASLLWMMKGHCEAHLNGNYDLTGQGGDARADALWMAERIIAATQEGSEG
jgi:AcrR family transcriptional regulator